LLITARPRLTGHSRRDWLVVLGFGTTLMIMNWSFYQSEFRRNPYVDDVGPAGPD
jgi:inner membrane transporter RhtA